MLTERMAAEAVRAAGLDAPVHFAEVTGSSNSDLLRLAGEGAPEWTVFVADQQVAGRGRMGRTWVSSPGSSLMVSVLLRPSLAPAEATILALGAGAAMALACEKGCGVQARCKWPNDLMMGGRKLGGVLVEAQVQDTRLLHAVIGVGVNLTQRAEDFPLELRENATSVAQEGGRPDAAVLLSSYIGQLARLCDPRRPAFRSTVLQAYRGLCDTVGRSVRATTTSGSEIAGLAQAIGDAGELIVETSTGQERVGFGEVVHLD
jgi:BirA family transcriptional regulator, biotin operon repressor / biotin---[acetyl-CoA-carboxylase] ligase